MVRFISRRAAAAALALAVAVPAALLVAAPRADAADKPSEIRLDWATYNPISLVLKEDRILEEALKADGISVRWVQSLGSNKALEFLNASSLDFGSTAGAAALMAAIGGNPIRSIYVYSRPEWTALVVPKDSKIKALGDLKGKRIAVTRGTDPHIFLLQALAKAGLKAADTELVLLQHQDGRLALERGDVDAWAGLDPLMAAAELQAGATLLYRAPELNSWGILNVRSAFADAHPELVRKVLAAYEEARKRAIADKPRLVALLAAAARLPVDVIERQLTRTDLAHGPIGSAQRATITAAGKALQSAGVIAGDVDVDKVVGALIDERFNLRRSAELQLR